MLALPPRPGRREDDALARRRVAWVAVITLALFALVSWQLAPLQPDALALQFAYTPRLFGTIVHAWTPEQLASYRAHLPTDALLLLGYGTLGWLLVRRTPLFAAAGAAMRRVLAWLLPLAASADAVEDGFHAWLTAAPRFGVPWAYLASSMASSLKWALLVAFALAVAWALARQPE